MRIRTNRGNVKHVYRCAGSWGAPVVALLFFAAGSLLVFDRPSWFWLWGQDWMIIYRFLLPILLAMAFSARFPAASVLVALLTLLGQFSGFLPTMFGVIEFYYAAKEAGIQPIIGLETYMAARSMKEHDPKEDRKSSHTLLLAENETGRTCSKSLPPRNWKVSIITPALTKISSPNTPKG